MRDLPAPAPDDPRALDLHIATCSLYVGLVLRAPHTSREEEVPPSRAPPPRSPDVPQMHGALDAALGKRWPGPRGRVCRRRGPRSLRRSGEPVAGTPARQGPRRTSRLS